MERHDLEGPRPIPADHTRVASPAPEHPPRWRRRLEIAAGAAGLLLFILGVRRLRRRRAEADV